MKLSEVLFELMSECIRLELSFSLEYDNGKRIRGEFIDLPEEEQRQHIRQDPAGWNIGVGGLGNKELLSDLNKAISAGLYMLKEATNEKGSMSPLVERLGL